MTTGFKIVLSNKIIASLVTLLLALSLISFKFEKTLSQDSVKTHIHISFPVKTPSLRSKVLVFFGYVGCPKICTTRMKEIADIYHDFAGNNNSENLSVLFVNLENRHSTGVADKYAQFYSQKFNGVTYGKSDLNSMLKQFRASYSRGMSNKNEIYHSKFLYLVQKNNNGEYFVKQIYIHSPFNKEKVINDLVEGTL